jgi:serine/threonine protein kinase
LSGTLINEILLNRYRIDAFIASGGMGAVYRVWDLKRNVPLAMKVLHSDLAEDPSMFKRFQREANALKKLAHPNIVPFYGLYQADEFDFLLERFIDGPSLQNILKKRREPLPVEEALIYLKVLCAALGYAHASGNGVVHCDVKPGNVMIDRGGSIYLTDFGIARHSESTTTTMGTAGTPAYMAPEQIRGEAVTPATDIYALGVVLYEMLTGKRPFRGNEAGTEKGGTTVNERIRYGHLNLQPPDPRSINPAISVGMANAILKALAKRPQDRYASTLDFFNAICLQAGETAGAVADRVVLPADFIKQGALTRQERDRGVHPDYPPVPAPRQRSPWLVIIGVAVCVLVIGGIVLISVQPGSRLTAVPNPQFPATMTQVSIATQPPVIPPTDRPIPASTQTPSSTPQSSWEQGQIVFVEMNASKLNDIYLMDMAADAVPRLLLSSTSKQQLYGPSLSPDSSKMVYYDANGGNNGILDVQTLTVHEFPACNSPTFSADGSQIICSGGGRFLIRNASGSQVDSLDVGQNGWLPIWSPDGAEVAFAVINGKSSSIWKISSSGGQAVPLASEAFENYAPTWSPDGQWIAYQAGDGSGHEEIWIMDQNGGNQQQVTHTSGGWSRGPVWSPDGDWLAFVSLTAGSVDPDFGDVFVISLHTGELVQITRTGGRVLDWRVTWGP